MYQHQMSNEYEVIKETSTPCNDCKLQASIRCTDCKVEQQRPVDNMLPSFVQSGNINSSSNNSANGNDRKGAPSPNDVVCARGRSYWNHPGNRMYRKLIAMAKADYLTASNRFEKSVIVSKIMDAVHDKSGIFVKKVVTSKNNDDGSDGNARWVECSEAFVREKIAQSIRDGLPFKYSSSTTRKRERAAQKEAANEKNRRDYEKKLQNDLFYPRKVTSAMKQPQSMSGAATAPSSLSLMLESTFLGGRSDGSTQHYDTANIANQAMEILSDDVKHIFDDDRMAGGIEVDRIESMGNGPAHHDNNGDFSKQQDRDNHDLWEHNHLHDDLEPMPLSSDEEDEAMQLELLQLTAHNDHVDLFPRPFADGLIDGSRGGDRRCSNYIRSSSNNNNNNDWLEGMDHKKPSADTTSSSRNSNNGAGGNSGDLYQSFMRQHWGDLPIELSPSNIAEEIVSTFQPQDQQN